MIAEQMTDRIKIASVSAASAWQVGAVQASASLAEAKRRRERSAWEWGLHAE